MSKRSLAGIAAITLVALSAGIGILRRPEEGSIEYHVVGAREAVELADLVQANAPHPRLLLNRLFHGDRTVHDYVDQYESHIEALIKLGYLEQRRFVFRNEATTEAAWDALFQEISEISRTSSEVGNIRGQPWSNAVVIIARPELMPAWEKFVEEYDRKLGASENSATNVLSASEGSGED